MKDPDMSYLQISGLSKAFGKKKVLDGLDLDVRQGECLVVFGGSGSGSDRGYGDDQGSILWNSSHEIRYRPFVYLSGKLCSAIDDSIFVLHGLCPYAQPKCQIFRSYQWINQYFISRWRHGCEQASQQTPPLRGLGLY